MPPGKLTNAVSIAVAFLVPGTVINSPVFDAEGNLLIEEKVPITREIIDALKQKRIDRIYYVQAGRQGPPSDRKPSAIEPDLLDKKILALSEDVFSEVATSVRENTFIQTTGVHLLVDLILKNLSAKEILPPEFVSPKPASHGFLGHALHTTVLSMFIALKHGFENTLVKQIGIGAFLHDIGSLKLPREMVDKEEFGSEEENALWKKHPALGFELVKLNGQLSGTVRKIILLHHETMDGTGYPLGIHEKDVGYYPYIVGLASAFDCFVSERDFRKPLPLREALLKLISFSGSVFPPYLVQLFVKHVSKTPAVSSSYDIGQFVILSSREIARVLVNIPGRPDKPDVLVVRLSDGSDAIPPWKLSLATDPVRSIAKGISGELQQQLERRYPPGDT